MCTGLEIALLIGAVAGATGTAVAASQANTAGKTQNSLAQDAARRQEQAFAASQQTFTQEILPAAPVPEVIKEQAKEEALRRRQRAAQTILTSSVGIVGEPNIARKTLLGQ